MLQDSDSSNKKLLKGLRLCVSYILKFSPLRFIKKKNIITRAVLMSLACCPHFQM